MTNAVGWTLPKAPPLPKAGQPPADTRRTLTTASFAKDPAEIQARLLTTIWNHYTPDEYIPQIESLVASATAAWPKFVAACISPSPCPELLTTEQVLRHIKITNEDRTELKPEPYRGISYKPPPPGYKIILPEAVEQRQSNSTASSAPAVPFVRRRASAGSEFIRLGTGMQPTLSRRKSSNANANLPRVRSLFLSGRKSEKARAAEEKARAAEEKAREEQEKAEKETQEQESEPEANAEANQGAYVENGADDEDEIQRNDDIDVNPDWGLDVTVRDAAEIETMEGMDESMIQSQRNKEARPRIVSEILKKMHMSNSGPRNIVTEEADLPAPPDTEYARLKRKEEAKKKKKAHDELAMEKEKQVNEQRKLKFARKRKRKLQKAGRVVRSDSEEEDQTSVAPEDDSTAGENSGHLGDPYNRDPEHQDAQRRRIDPPNGYEDRREADDRYRGRPQEGANRYDDPGRYNYPQPPPDPRRYGERPPQWQHASYPYHPTSSPPNYGPPSYYAPPSPYYGYHPPPYYPHHAPPPPPPQQYYRPRAPPRLSREEFDKKRNDLYQKIGKTCNDLHTDDARAIDDFLDNQDHMFRANEKAKYYVLEQTPQGEVLLRIDREQRSWKIVRRGESS